LQRLRGISRKKSAEMTRLYSQVRWLGQHNAGLVLQNIDANTKMADLGTRQQALEEELARADDERDVQRAAVEQKTREAEAQTAELQRKEVELQREKATIATLTGTLEEKGKALEEKEVALRNAEAALQEKENYLSSLEEAARVQREEAQKSIAGECSKFRCYWVLAVRSLPLFL